MPKKHLSEKSPLVEMNERDEDHGTFPKSERRTTFPPSTGTAQVHMSSPHEGDEEGMAKSVTSTFTEIIEDILPVKQPDSPFAADHSPFYDGGGVLRSGDPITNKDVTTFDHLMWAGYGMSGTAIAGAQVELAQAIKQMGEVDMSKYAQDRFDEILSVQGSKEKKKVLVDFSNTRTPSPLLEKGPSFPKRDDAVLASDSFNGPLPHPDDKKRILAKTRRSGKKNHTYRDPAALHREDKYPILFQTLGLVAVAVIGKYWLHVWQGFEGYVSLGEIGMVFTGLFFIQGIVFGSATSDLKAAQALPGAVVVILEEMEDHFMYSSRKVIAKNLTLSYPQSLILHFAEKWREYLLHQKESSYWHCELILREIVLLAALWDSKGASVGKVPELVGKLRDPLSSAAFIHRAEYLPATHILLLFFVSTASILMMLVKFNSLTVMFGVTASVLTVIWFTLRLIKALRNPFNVAAPKGIKKWINGYMAAVQLFQLNEYIEKLGYRRMVQKRREALLYGVRISSYWDSAIKQAKTPIGERGTTEGADVSDPPAAETHKSSTSLRSALAARKAFGKWHKTTIAQAHLKDTTASSPTLSATAATASNLGSFNNQPDETTDNI